MARAQYVGVVQDTAGNALPNIPVTVNLHGAGAAAIYAAENGGSALGSISSDATGSFSFWVDTTLGPIDVVPSGFGTRTVGLSGPTAVANWRGAWSGATTYALGDGVYQGGFPFISNVAGNLNNTPSVVNGSPVSTASWSPALPLPASVVTSSPVPASAANGQILTARAGAVPVWVGPTQNNVQSPLFAGGADGTGAADSYAAIAAALALAGDTVFPPGAYKFGTTLALVDGQRLVGAGGQIRWRAGSPVVANPTTLTFTGTGSAVKVANPATGQRESVELSGLRFDGTGLSGAVDGLLIDGTLGGAGNYTEGLFFDRCAFTNFPRNQVRMDGLLIDITFKRCAFLNPAQLSSSDLVAQLQTKTGGIVTQTTFDDCFLSQYSTGGWSFKNIANVGDVRFLNGTVAPFANGITHGIWHGGALMIMGTHIEGQPTLAGIGVRWYGAAGATIMPSQVTNWGGEGIQIGDPTQPAAQASGAVIAGSIGTNGPSGGPYKDVHIISGGSRVGTVLLSTGNNTGSPGTLIDDRATTDGINEVMAMSGGYLQTPKRLQVTSASVLGAPGNWYSVVGVPPVGLGANGDFALRQDGAAGSCLYQKRTGAWVATAA